jgi:hypothetical protein
MVCFVREMVRSYDVDMLVQGVSAKNWSCSSKRAIPLQPTMSVKGLCYSSKADLEPKLVFTKVLERQSYSLYRACSESPASKLLSKSDSFDIT